MATGIFSVTLEDLKQQADEFGLEGKDKTKSLKEGWWKMQDVKLQKERFEMEKNDSKKMENDRKKKEKRKTIRKGAGSQVAV